MKLVIIISLSIFGGVLTQADNFEVEAPAGRFKGHSVVKTRGGRDVISFEGIPYAKPPIGELRFKDPVEMPKLEGVYDATDGSKMCLQSSDFTRIKNISLYAGSEDCLYLNVHKPKDADKSSLLPVMVWIHGGGFFLGSGSRFLNGPDYLLDKNMIFVTMNYRLGLLGFLFEPSRGIAGNFGMKDQTMALKWVKDNIKAFGGDPNMITIAGESAGGSAASLHMHSPLSKGLFQKAIAQSGTVYSPFATDPAVVASNARAKAVIEDLGCSTEKEKTLRCLQKIAPMELIKTTIKLIPEEMNFNTDFTPVLEEPSASAFITEASYKEPSDIPLITGVTSRESMFMMFEAAAKSMKYNGDLAKMKEDLDVLMSIWGRYEYNTDKKDINEKLMKFYYGPSGNKSHANIVQITDFMSDIMFNHAAHKAAQTEKGPTYIYKFSYIGEQFKSLPAPEGLQDGVGHAEDLRYLFKSSFFLPTDIKWSDQSEKMSENLVDMWFNFMKYGNPTPDTKEWEESNKGVKYLDMTNDGLKMKTNMFQERVEFLDNLNIDRFSKVHVN